MSLITPITTPADLGAAVRHGRKSRGMSLEDLSSAAGVDLRFISELERGKPTARLAETLRVLEALGMQLSLDDPLG